MWKTSTTNDLVRRLGAPGSVVVADLSFGCWAGQSAAAQLGRQLGVESRTKPLVPDVDWSQVQRDWNYADIIGTSIDWEAYGDATLSDALVEARRVLEVLVRSTAPRCAVILPEPPTVLARYDQLFIRELTRLAADMIDIDLITYGADSSGSTARPNLPGQPELPAAALVPGLIDNDLFKMLHEPSGGSTFIPLGGGFFLVAPELRLAARGAGPLDYDRLAARMGDRPEVAAYASRRGSVYYASPVLLCQQAWREQSARHEEAAVELLQHAVRCSVGPLQRAICSAQLGGLAIATRRFELSVQLEIPSAAPRELRGFLHQCRGWGLVMSGRPEEALVELHQASSELVAWRHRAEYLYLLNIMALATLRAGDADEALALETQISEGLAAGPVHDDHLRYVNELNLARLYRRREEPEAAREHYSAAFSTTRHVGTQGDLIHEEVCAAQLDLTQHRLADAATAWLRIALFWAGMDQPQALGPRVTAAITETSWLRGAVTPEEISAAVLARLRELELLSDRPSRTGSPVVASICWLADDLRLRSPDDLSDAVLLADPGWSVLVAPTRWRRHDVDLDDGRHEIRTAIVEVLQRLRPLPLLHSRRTLLVDDRLRRGIARTAAEAVESALRLGVTRLVLGGREYRMTHDLVVEAVLRSRVTVSCAVAGWEGVQSTPGVTGDRSMHVRFRRYRPPVRLAEPQTRMLRAIQERQAPTVRDLLETVEPSHGRPAEIVRQLERERVVEVAVEEETCRWLLDRSEVEQAAFLQSSS